MFYSCKMERYYFENLTVVAGVIPVMQQGILEWRGLKLQGPLYYCVSVSVSGYTARRVTHPIPHPPGIPARSHLQFYHRGP